MTRRRLGAAAAACAVLAACAHVPAPPGDVDRFEGRLSVQVTGDSERSFSAGFELAGSAEEGRMVLTTPLGMQAAQADWSAQSVRLRSGRGERFFPDLDSLSREALGESMPLPLGAMFDWLHGRPWARAVSVERRGGFEQLGWAVDVSRRAEGWVLAQRLGPPVVTVSVKLDEVQGAADRVGARPDTPGRAGEGR